jgi:hypothetical protein
MSILNIALFSKLELISIQIDVQAGYQVAALFVTLGIAIGSGVITGFLMKIPIVEQVKDEENLFDDELYWEHIDHMVVQSDSPTNDQQESNL